MEATRDAQGLLYKIRPPRLDDACFKDCALPPDSIKEAFLKAATAIGSRAASVFSSNFEKEEEGRSCVEDPWGEEKLGDDLVGVREGVDSPPGDCVAEKGGGLGEVMGDEMVAGLTEAEERRGDKVVDGREGVEAEGGEVCVVDGLKGLKIGEKKGDKNSEWEEDETFVLEQIQWGMDIQLHCYYTTKKIQIINPVHSYNQLQNATNGNLVANPHHQSQLSSLLKPNRRVPEICRKMAGIFYARRKLLLSPESAMVAESAAVSITGAPESCYGDLGFIIQHRNLATMGGV